MTIPCSGNGPDLTEVLHVLEAVRGGTIRYLIDVVRWTPGTVHHVALPRLTGVAGRSGALADTGAWDDLEAAGAQLHRVDMRRNPAHPANGAALVALRRLIAGTRPDVVHGHSSVGGALARLAAWSTPVPCVYTPNGLLTGRPAVACERWLGRRTERLIAVSATEAERVTRLGLVPPARVVTIANGIDLAAAARDPVVVDLRARLGLAPGTPLVGTVARVVAQKAPEQFVRACAGVARRRPDVHFLLIGLGPLQSRVDQEVAAAGLGPRFHQIPQLAGAAAVMGQLDVFALLSRYEGGAYTPLEAMRAGVPVVLSDVVGNHDTVEHGVSGLLVPFGDAGAAASAVVNLLDQPELRAAMVAVAHQRLRALFDVRLTGQQLAGLYLEVAGCRRSTRRLPHASSGRSSKRPDASASK